MNFCKTLIFLLYTLLEISLRFVLCEKAKLILKKEKKTLCFSNQRTSKELMVG